MPQAAAWVKSWKGYLKLARLENAILPGFALAAGFTIAGAHDYQEFALTTLVLVLIHSVVTVWNDIADEGSDQHNDITYISELRKSGAYDAVRLSIVIAVLIIITTIIFLPTLTKLLVAISFLLGWAYNSPPIRASRRPLASISLLGGAYGTVPFLLGVSLGRFSLLAIYLAVGWTIGRASLSLLKDYKDARGDAIAKKKTFLLVYGGTRTARLSFGLALIGYAVSIVVIAMSVRRSAITAVLLSGIAGWLLLQRARLFRAKQYTDLNQIFHECLKYQLIFDGFAVICLRTL